MLHLYISCVIRITCMLGVLTLLGLYKDVFVLAQFAPHPLEKSLPPLRSVDLLA